VHAYAQTARQFAIDSSLLTAFFESMRMDIDKQSFTKKQYDEYIYGSAEVIGLMCLSVFVQGEKERYESLETGARALGSAYQKVNFLRDMKSDYVERGRVYFPLVDFDSFSETHKRAIEEDIEADFAVARQAIDDFAPLRLNQDQARMNWYSKYLTSEL
jgi:phytoene/squalene synthetase